MISAELARSRLPTPNEAAVTPAEKGWHQVRKRRSDAVSAHGTDPRPRSDPPEGVCPRVVPKARRSAFELWPTPYGRARAEPETMAVGRVNAAPIARLLCCSSVDATPRARGPRQVVAAGV
eukprot:scaffold5742_cov61-Phaeocystis_antarctica.AAC.3